MEPATRHPTATHTDVQTSVAIKAYVEQAVRPDGLAVDKLPYSPAFTAIVAAVNRCDPLNQVTERDVYLLLLFLRKNGRLPRLFKEGRRSTPDLPGEDQAA